MTIERIGASTLYLGDCLEAVPRLVSEGVIVDAIVTDPPYHLQNAGPRADALRGDRSHPIGRMLSGFMGQRWDGGDIAMRAETWAAMLPILRPGGYLITFGGERTFHRVWCAIEDSGFVIQTTICWLWGSGFPKHKSDLKPSWNPICVGYKPGGKRELQIDECRIEVNRADIKRARVPQPMLNSQTGKIYNMKTGTGRNGEIFDLSPGRWPANCVHDGSDEVMEAFARFGEHGGGFMRPKTRHSNSHGTVYGKMSPITAGATFGNTGSAARFYYTAKASQHERLGSQHPTQKPVALMEWLVKLVCPKDGTVLDPFMGSGTTGVACANTGRRFIGIEREEGYFRTACFRVEKETVTGVTEFKHQSKEGGLLW